MKPKLQTILILLALALLLGAGLAATGKTVIAAPESDPLSQQTTPTDNGTMRSVSVSAVGQVATKPDMAIIDMGVQTDAKEAASALTQNSDQMQALIDALKKSGVASEDLQTQTIRLLPRYTNSPSNQQELSGFTATNTVEIRVRNLDNLGKLLDSAIQAGGNTINQIQFEISDTGPLVTQARQAAMQSAHDKASALAKLADAQLGPVISISENSSTPQPVPLNTASAPSAMAAVPVEAGTQNVTVNVQVTWELLVSGNSGQSN